MGASFKVLRRSSVGDALPAVGDTPHVCGGAAPAHVGDALPARRILHDGHRPVPPQVERVLLRRREAPVDLSLRDVAVVPVARELLQQLHEAVLALEVVCTGSVS